MTDKPRPWPNVAKEARDKAAEAACIGIRALEPIVSNTRPLTESERIRAESIALHSLERIARLLESVGAQTRP